MYAEIKQIAQCTHTETKKSVNCGSKKTLANVQTWSEINGQKVRFGKTLSDVRNPNRQRRQVVGPLTIYFDNIAGLVYLGLKSSVIFS